LLSHLRRREFITLLGGAAAWPHGARGQQPAMPVIGFLHDAELSLFIDSVRAFHQGLNQSGFAEGRNVTIEYRWAEGQNDRLPAMAADLVRRRVAVIVTSGSRPAILAAKAATTTIPIVFQTAGDPVGQGYVVSLNRPGGNLTGVTSLNTEIVPKRLEMMHELVPTATTLALLVHPTGLEIQSRGAQAAARTLGLQLHVLQASTKRDFDSVFTSLPQVRARALLIGNNPVFFDGSEQLAALALRHGVPTISPYREFAAVGGLMSYGTDQMDQSRMVGAYTGRILKGEQPADLPVQQATKYEFIINLKTATALGLTVPRILLARADILIE